MANDLASIECNPVKGGVREVVDVVPAELLSKESGHTGESADLRQLGRVTKGVRQPEGCAALAKTALKEALAKDELANQRLAAGHVGVMLDPATADREEGATFYLCLDTVKHRRIVLL